MSTTFSIKGVRYSEEEGPYANFNAANAGWLFLLLKLPEAGQASKIGEIPAVELHDRCEAFLKAPGAAMRALKPAYPVPDVLTLEQVTEAFCRRVREIQLLCEEAGPDGVITYS